MFRTEGYGPSHNMHLNHVTTHSFAVDTGIVGGFKKLQTNL